MTPYIFFLILTAIFFVITLVRLYKDRRKKINKREAALEYFYPLHEATGSGAVFSFLMIIMVWWTIIKILLKALDILLNWIN